jgi:hypothetical protein
MVCCRCGIILLSYAAIFILHISRSALGSLVLIQKAPQFQKIVYTESRSARGSASEGILCRQICHVGQKGVQFACLVVVEDSILTPIEPSCHQLVFGATSWVKGMGYAEPALCGSDTACIR